MEADNTNSHIVVNPKDLSVNPKAAHGRKGGQVNITLNEAQDPSGNTEGKFKALESLVQLHAACWFGLRLMVPGTFVWSGDKFNFSQYNSQFPHATNSFRVDGEVISYTNNLPLIIRLKSAEWPKNYKWIDIHYEYDFLGKQRLYPVNIWADLNFEGDLHLQGMGIQILDIEFGKIETETNGFTETMFLPTNSFNEAGLIISSNASTYWIHAGKLEKIQPPSGRIMTYTTKLIIRVFLVVLILMPVAIFCTTVIKKQKQKTK